MKKVVLASLLFACFNAYAEDATVAAKVSTLGFGVDVAMPITGSIDGRVGLNKFNYNLSKSVSSNTGVTDYSGQLNLQSLEALADYHPWASSFRLTGGFMYNDNKFSMTAVPGAGGVNIGGTNYANVSATATVDFRKFSPYLGIGWGSAPKDKGLSFAADIGVLFQGSPNGNVTTTGNAVSAADLSRANADLNNSLHNFRYYPVVSLGIGYTF